MTSEGLKMKDQNKFTIGSKTFEAKDYKEGKCDKCDYRNFKSCAIIPPCSPQGRDDGRSVIFKEI